MAGGRTLMKSILATAALGLTPILAAAGVPKNGPDIVDAAFKKLDDRANQTRAQDALPRWSTPEDRTVLEQIWSVPTILGAPPYTAQDLAALINIGVRENAVLKSYVLFAPNPSLQPDTAKNVMMFQDEILHGQAFAVRLSAAMLTALGDFAGRMKADQLTGEKANNLKELREDLVERVEAASESVNNAALKVENRAMLVDALADSAEPLAIASTPKDREAFATTAQSAMPSLSPAEQGRIKLFVDAMKRQDCQTLCKLP